MHRRHPETLRVGAIFRQTGMGTKTGIRPCDGGFNFLFCFVPFDLWSANVENGENRSVLSPTSASLLMAHGSTRKPVWVDCNPSGGKASKYGPLDRSWFSAQPLLNLYQYFSHSHAPTPSRPRSSSGFRSLRRLRISFDSIIRFDTATCLSIVINVPT